MSDAVRFQGRRWVAAGVLAGAALAAPLLLATHDDASDAARVIEHLRVKPGMTLAEIGAGRGELTVALAKAVGPEGRVFSNELNRDRHATIRAAAERAGLSNVTIVEGGIADANLPEACCDGIFMRDVYHHFTDPGPMNRSLWRALKPGGRIAILDFPPRGREAASAANRARRGGHGISAATIERELREAGFAIVVADDGGGAREILVVGEKP